VDEDDVFDYEKVEFIRYTKNELKHLAINAILSIQSLKYAKPQTSTHSNNSI